MKPVKKVLVALVVAVLVGSVCAHGDAPTGRIVAWGDNSSGQGDVPTPNMGFVAIAAEGFTVSV